MADGSVRALRHEAGESIAAAFVLLPGEPGLSRADQVARLAQAADLLDKAASVLREAAELAESREVSNAPVEEEDVDLFDDVNV